MYSLPTQDSDEYATAPLSKPSIFGKISITECV
jgi:hypothetical protein